MAQDGAVETRTHSEYALSRLEEKRSDASVTDGGTSPSAAKAKLILQACHCGDIPALTNLATSEGGFINDDIRKVAWPILLGSDRVSAFPQDEPPWETLPPHREEVKGDQIEKDVARSFVHYPQDGCAAAKELEHLRTQLSQLLLEVLRRHPSLDYFQGYHDISQVFLLVLGPSLASKALRRASLLRFRDHMLVADQYGTYPHLRLVPTILCLADQDIYKLLPPKPHPNTGVQAIMTLFAHDIQNYDDIARLYDCFLAREVAFVPYFFAALILDRKEELLNLDEDYYHEPNMLSAEFQKFPQPVEMDRMIEQATELFARYPPEILPDRAWRRVSVNSALKTTRDTVQIPAQTVEQAQAWFDHHLTEIKRQKALDEIFKAVERKTWMYRRKLRLFRRQMLPYRRGMFMSVAFAIGMVGWWLGRTPRWV